MAALPSFQHFSHSPKVHTSKIFECKIVLIFPPISLNIYFMLSSETNAYKKQIKVLSITSEIIYQSLVIDNSLYFHCSVFWITTDFSIHLMQLTSKVQTPITFLFVNENIKCG